MCASVNVSVCSRVCAWLGMMYLCMCVSAHACVCVLVCVCMCVACRGQRRMASISLYYYLPYFFELEFLTNIQLIV